MNKAMSLIAVLTALPARLAAVVRAFAKSDDDVSFRRDVREKRRIKERAAPQIKANG